MGGFIEIEDDWGADSFSDQRWSLSAAGDRCPVEEQMEAHISLMLHFLPGLRYVVLTSYPDPFVGETTVEFTVQKPAHVRLEVFDVLGRRIETVTDQRYSMGVHRLHWNGQSLLRGVFFVREEVGGRPMKVKEMVRR